MIECPSCGCRQRHGTLFCSNCGEFLVARGSMVTVPFSPGEPPDAAEESSWSNEPRAADAAASSLQLKVVSSGRTVQLPDAPEALVGRYDAAHNIYPDLNLTPDGGLEGGVSRRHCKIHRQGGVYLVEDVGSANGTFVNGCRLTAYLPHEIKEGDSLQLGGMKLVVSTRS